MKHRPIFVLLAVLMISAMVLSACAPAPAPTEAPAAPAPTEAPAAPTEAPAAPATEAGPCLKIGALFGGAVTDAGYNQAFYELSLIHI